MWIARDKDGEIYLYSSEPYLSEAGIWKYAYDYPIFTNTEGYPDHCVQLASDIYPEITFENSPKRLIVE